MYPRFGATPLRMRVPSGHVRRHRDRALAAGLRYDLVRTNALKVVCTAAFSVVALAVFAATGRVEWASGIILAVGMTIGAYASVRFALNVSQRIIKWALFAMVCLTSASVFLFT